MTKHVGAEFYLVLLGEFGIGVSRDATDHLVDDLLRYGFSVFGLKERAGTLGSLGRYVVVKGLDGILA